MKKSSTYKKSKETEHDLYKTNVKNMTKCRPKHRLLMQPQTLTCLPRIFCAPYTVLFSPFSLHLFSKILLLSRQSRRPSSHQCQSLQRGSCPSSSCSSP